MAVGGGSRAFSRAMFLVRSERWALSAAWLRGCLLVSEQLQTNRRTSSVQIVPPRQPDYLLRCRDVNAPPDLFVCVPTVMRVERRAAATTSMRWFLLFDLAAALGMSVYVL